MATTPSPNRYLKSTIISENKPKLSTRHKRLSAFTGNQKIRLTLRWILPAMMSLAVIIFINGNVKAAPTPPSESAMATYLQTNQLQLVEGEVNGYDQIFYNYEGNTYQITTDNFNHYSAVASGPNIVWAAQVNDGSQIYEYNILTAVSTQLTADGINDAPDISGGIVTWQSWNGTSWQIMYYNGTNTYQITDNNYSSVNASTNGQVIIYAQDLGKNWNSYSYNLSNSQASLLASGDIASAGYPHFNSDGSVSTNAVAQ